MAHLQIRCFQFYQAGIGRCLTYNSVWRNHSGIGFPTGERATIVVETIHKMSGNPFVYKPLPG